MLGTSTSEEVTEIKRLLQNETQLRKTAEEEVNKLNSRLENFMQSMVWIFVNYEGCCINVIVDYGGCCISMISTSGQFPSFVFCLF